MVILEQEEKMVDYSCERFIDALASSAAVPGGGGALGVASSMGIALNNMVCNLTIGKKKYAEFEVEIKEILVKGELLQKKLLYIVQLDAAVFKPLSEAYSLPTTTDAEKEFKLNKLSKCSIKASQVPIMAAEMCVEALELTRRIAEIGSKLVISDSACAAELLLASLKCSRYNVIINQSGIIDEKIRVDFISQIDALVVRGKELANEIEEIVVSRM